MELQQLRNLQTEISNAIELLARLEPVVAAWQHVALRADVVSASGASNGQNGMPSPLVQ